MAKKSEVEAVLAVLRETKPDVAKQVEAAFGLTKTATSDLNADVAAFVAHILNYAVDSYIEDQYDDFEAAMMEATGHHEDFDLSRLNAKAIRQNMQVQNAVAKAVNAIIRGMTPT